MSVRPRQDDPPRQGCVARLASALAARVSDVLARRRANRAHRRLVEEAAAEGLTAKRNTVTRTDGQPIGNVQLIAGDTAEITSIVVARPTPRERFFRTRLVSLRNAGTYVGTIAVDLRRQQWRARPPINAHSVQSGSEVPPIDSEVERALLYALKYART